MSTSTTRLHISPLSPDLLTAILGAHLQKSAQNISYHSLQTFPEGNYGFVDLPSMEAERIKKKLNGTILKGKKIKLEEARPRKRKHVEEDPDLPQDAEQDEAAPVKERRKSKRDRNIMAGHQLSPDRKVKRGWTEVKSDQPRKRKNKTDPATKQQATSKYSNQEEVLFKTKIPKNKTLQRTTDTGKRKKANKDGTEMVHEFENSTTVPSFLRNDASEAKTALAYQDGEGWVDNDGQTYEKEAPRVTRRREAATHGRESKVVRKTAPKVVKQRVSTSRPSKSAISDGSISNQSETTNSDDDGEDDYEEEAESSEENLTRIDTVTDADADIDVDAQADETSSSGSSEPTSTSDASSAPDLDAEEQESALNTDIADPTSSVHPLEALFKKPIKPALSKHSQSQEVVKPSLEVQTSFTFFESHEDKDGDEDQLPPIPMTPFSSQDLRGRGTRSAAPTPDTAHPSRMNSIFNGEESEGELSEMEDANAGEQSTTGEQRSTGDQTLQLPQTDFEKEFWEKRGENNRAWKARRRAALKEQRQRENRARRPKNW